MHATHSTHHFHIAAFWAVPLFLLAIASVWGEIQASPILTDYAYKADRAEQKLALMDTEFRDLQKAYSLLTEGEEKATYKSAAYERSKLPTGTAFQRYADARQRIMGLKNRIEAYRRKFKEFGDHAIHIKLAKQEMAFVQDGVITRRYKISSGSPATPTPKGKFQIHRKQELRISQQEVPYRMPYYMAFTKSQSHGLHALPYLGRGPESSDYWHEALDHIGIPVSHGCVRLLPEDAEELYQMVEVGTPLYINA